MDKMDWRALVFTFLIIGLTGIANIGLFLLMGYKLKATTPIVDLFGLAFVIGVIDSIIIIGLLTLNEKILKRKKKNDDN